jgi:hypothetical protein
MSLRQLQMLSESKIHPFSDTKVIIIYTFICILYEMYDVIHDCLMRQIDMIYNVVFVLYYYLGQ